MSFFIYVCFYFYQNKRRLIKINIKNFRMSLYLKGNPKILKLNISFIVDFLDKIGNQRFNF